MTIWESLGWSHPSYNKNGKRLSFWYDTKRKEIVHREIPERLGWPDHIIEVPKVYEKNFRNNPEKAMRDLAGIPPVSGSTFISLTHKIDDAIEAWIERYGPESPVSSDPQRPVIADWFVAQDSLRRGVHLDIGYSGQGDAAGIVMGHVSHLVKADDAEDKEKPFIVVDCIIRVKAPQGSEVFLGDLRRHIYDLKERGFKIQQVTMDGFQSTDTRQQLARKRLNPEYLSVDKSKLPYEDLRDTLYENRLALPPYVTYINLGDDKTVNIAFKEISELEDTGRKIDHPVNGSKDVADGIAAIVTRMMGDRTYRRGVRSTGERNLNEQSEETVPTPEPSGYEIGGYSLPGLGGFGGAPIPPSIPGSVLDMPIPHSLRPSRRDRR
jgi:hypothetical protein